MTITEQPSQPSPLIGAIIGQASNPPQSTTVTVTTAPPAPPKPGYKTTEFWLKIAALVVASLLASGVIPTTGVAAQVTAIAATVLGALGYTVGRSMAKASGAVMLISLVLFATPHAGCAASQRTTTLQTAQIAISATAAGVAAYDRPHQDELAVLGTPDQAAAALKAYRAKRAVLDKAIAIAVDALIVAVRLNDQPSLDGLSAAITEVLAAYKALKGTTP